MMWNGEKMIATNRLSYEVYNGPIGDKHVCHRCDNPACINPQHLFLGDHVDNMADTKVKGRATIGERGNNKLG